MLTVIIVFGTAPELSGRNIHRKKSFVENVRYNKLMLTVKSSRLDVNSLCIDEWVFHLLKLTCVFSLVMRTGTDSRNS